MIRHKLPNKTKSATVAEPKLFHQLNNLLVSAFGIDDSDIEPHVTASSAPPRVTPTAVQQ
jgi:hypothetical protein